MMSFRPSIHLRIGTRRGSGAKILSVRPVLLLAGATCALIGTVVVAQRQDAFVEPRDVPAIAYATEPVSDRVSALNQRLRDGSVQFSFRPTSGYLQSVLDALNIPIESQLAVFSQTSFQA